MKRAAEFALTQRSDRCADCKEPIAVSLHIAGRPVAKRERCNECAEKHIARRALEVHSETQEEKAKQTRHRTEFAMLELDVPALFADVTLDNFQLHGDADSMGVQRRVVDRGRRCIADWPVFQDITVLVGDPGTGKGHWMWSVVKAIVAQHGIYAEVVKLADMVRHLRSAWTKGEDSEIRILNRYRSRGLLAIDEVSSHAFYGQKIHQHLYDVIDHRIERRLPTILTTNESEDGLREILKPAIFNRMQYHGVVIDFGTESWRSRARDVA